MPIVIRIVNERYWYMAPGRSVFEASEWKERQEMEHRETKRVERGRMERISKENEDDIACRSDESVQAAHDCNWSTNQRAILVNIS